MSSGSVFDRSTFGKQISTRHAVLLALVFCIVPAAESGWAQDRSEIRESSSLLPSRQIAIGGRAGWEEIALFENTGAVDGWQGGYDLALLERRAIATDSSDMLLSFDDGFEDVAGHYRVTPERSVITDAIRRYGSGAAAFSGSDGLILEPVPAALFAGDAVMGNFSIEFWFYPNLVTDGARLLHWRGFVTETGSTVIQDITVEIVDGRLDWGLDGIVLVPDGGYESASLTGRRALVPRRWQHHRLSYDPETARLSYEIDGVPEDVRYLTDTGRQNGQPNFLYLGRGIREGLTIGDGVFGVVDEFRVHRGSVPAFEDSRYSGEPGSVHSVPIDLGSESSRLRAIDLRTVQPGSTEVRGYYRLGNRRSSRDVLHALDAPWTAIPADGTIPGTAYGRFLQLRVDLLADAPREQSPRLQEISITYETSPPPPSPTVLVGESIPGGVNLRWDSVRTGNIAGYRVFFGEEPGRYTGTTGVLSPFDAGDHTELEILGLKPDVPYVFAVQSYDNQGQTGPISREIEVRGGGVE